MAEGLMRDKFGSQIYCDSAGVKAGESDAFVMASMAELNIDMASHEPKKLDELDDTWFDLVITFSPQAHHIALEMQHVETSDVLYWPVWAPIAM